MSSSMLAFDSAGNTGADYSAPSEPPCSGVPGTQRRDACFCSCRRTLLNQPPSHMNGMPCRFHAPASPPQGTDSGTIFQPSGSLLTTYPSVTCGDRPRTASHCSLASRYRRRSGHPPSCVAECSMLAGRNRVIRGLFSVFSEMMRVRRISCCSNPPFRGRCLASPNWPLG
jgi:hypothetical protein